MEVTPSPDVTQQMYLMFFGEHADGRRAAYFFETYPSRQIPLQAICMPRDTSPPLMSNKRRTRPATSNVLHPRRSACMHLHLHPPIPRVEPDDATNAAQTSRSSHLLYGSMLKLEELPAPDARSGGPSSFGTSGSGILSP